MRKQNLIVFLIVLLVFPLFVHAYTISKLPAVLSFETPAERAEWKYFESDNAGANLWLIDRDSEYAYKGDFMLYMSQDDGASRTMTKVANQTFTCLAYCPLDGLPAGQYTVDFHYRGPKYNDEGNTFLYVNAETAEPTNAEWWWYDWNRRLFPNLWWQDAKYTFTAQANTTYYLCFRTHNHSEKTETVPGWAIDEIQIYPAENTSSCMQVPENVTHTRIGNNALFSWDGNASEYQVEYYTSDASSPVYHSADNITSTTYTVRSTSVPEGTYNFRVRAICGLDTSAWAALDYQLIYDAGQHCFDYLNFGASNVRAEYGWFSCPNCNQGKLDYGFESSDSRHTIHHYPHDYDERTNYQLRTYPKGQPAAIRLGNWGTGAEAEDIVYTMRVTPEMGVLQLQYALVMQLPNHSTAQQPRFTLEFRDSIDQLIDSCGYVDFTASRDLDTTWHTEHVEGSEDIIWKDWTLVGMNMRDYVNQTIQIRITTKDCSEGQHFGYAYFTLACSRGIIEGTHCGRRPDSLTVDEGFYYRWYRAEDEQYRVENHPIPRQYTIDTTRTLHLDNPYDTTTTYCVDMINRIDTNCYFTLRASTLAFITNPDADYSHDPGACKNYVKLSNHSTTEGVYWDANGVKHIIEQTLGVGSFYWDLGGYGRSTEWEPSILVPNSGASFRVVLHTAMEDGDCESTYAFNVKVPAIGPRQTTTVLPICKDSSLTYEGVIYSGPGKYIIDQYTLWTGCDSINWLQLNEYHTDTLHEKDLLCMSVGSMTWHGQTLTHGGIYRDTVKSLICNCDSQIYVLHLEEQPELKAQVDYTPQSFCYGAGEVEVPFTITSGTPTTYDLLFSDTAKMLGFKDRVSQPISELDDKLVITLNDKVWAGPYEATLVLHNRKCDTLHFPIKFTVYYNPDSLITQRWNDFLSVRKTAYDYYGGFYDYQWYRNGQALAGQTSSQLYLPDQKLQPTDSFYVELTRSRDSIRIRTCAFYPSVEPDSVTLIILPTVLSAQNRTPVHVRTTETGQVYAYNQSGLLVGQWAVKEEDNQLFLPATPGIYLLRVLFDSGRIETRKIIVE